MSTTVFQEMQSVCVHVSAYMCVYASLSAENDSNQVEAKWPGNPVALILTLITVRVFWGVDEGLFNT